jgi:protein-S-isoprenylcysteine O-methyltransferase Ste14
VIFRVIQLLWLLLMVYWIAGATRSKPTRRTEWRAWSWIRLALTVFIFASLFSPAARIGWLAQRFVPQTFALAVTGLILTALGIGLAAWARYTLGRNWSAAVALKQSHELVSTGPYARIRHPIYSGVLLGLVGTALAIGEWRALLAVVVLAASWLVKARKEEALLAEEFGEAFAVHRSRTGMFLPRLR